MGHFEQALKMYNQAFNLADQRKDMDRAALLAADIGEALSLQGKLQDSMDWLHTAAEILDSGRGSLAGADKAIAAKVDSRIGSVRHHLGNVLPAIDLYSRAYRAQARLLYPGHPDLVSTRLSMVHAQRDLGDSVG